MSEQSSLADRIEAEIASATDKVSEFKQQRVQEFHEKQLRLEKLEKVFEQLRDVWRPPLEVLSARFADRVQVTPSVEVGRRRAFFQFQSELAQINLRFSVMTDDDVRNVIFEYRLEILPVLMQFERHHELQMPVDNIDRQKLADWIDDRIMSFVKTYLELHHNHYYLKDYLVEDPIAKVKFPKYAAGAKLEWKGKTLYFLGDETRHEFEEQQAALVT